MDAENLQAAGIVGTIYNHLAVKTTRAHQSCIQHIWAVGCSHNDDAGIALKTVHLSKQLVEGLLALIVTTAESGTTLAAYGVDFVNEDDAGSTFLGLLEQVAHATGAHTHKHLNELRTGDGEEGNARLAGHGLGKQGLTGARRAHQQHTLGDLGANRGEAIWVLEKVNDFCELELGSLNAGHVAEGHLGLGLHLKPRLALTEIHRLIATTTLGATQQEKQTTKEQ